MREQVQEEVQKQAEAWGLSEDSHSGGRTPMQAVHDLDGREIVESLLLDWERRADQGVYQPGIRPDFNAVRKLLKLMPTTSPDVRSAERSNRGLTKAMAKTRRDPKTRGPNP